MVQGRDRRPELGYKLALECRKNINYPMKNKNSKFNNMPVNPDGTLASTIESNHNSVKVNFWFHVNIFSEAIKESTKVVSFAKPGIWDDTVLQIIQL